ncbi:hypothetical protein Hanom_Chr15g01411991 [Helianthus anomalus]
MLHAHSYDHKSVKDYFCVVVVVEGRWRWWGQVVVAMCTYIYLNKIILCIIVYVYLF